MKYVGSKNRLAKELLRIILLGRRHNQYYVEPFVGGANMIDKVTGNRIGNDNHMYLIALLIAVRDGWVPPTDVSRGEYYSIKSNKGNYLNHLVGFVGFFMLLRG